MDGPPGKGDSRVAAAVRQATGIAVAQTHQIAQYGAIALSPTGPTKHAVPVESNYSNAIKAYHGNRAGANNSLKNELPGNSARGNDFSRRSAHENPYTHQLRREWSQPHNAGNAPRGVDVASQAAKGFKNLECKECVAAIVKEMKAKGLSGEIIDLSTDVNRPFIYSDRLGGVISQNGTHQAVRIGDTVFDNLNPNGITYAEWLRDLHSVHGIDVKVRPF